MALTILPEETDFEKRLRALNTARDFLDPIIKSYPPQDYKDVTGPTMPFTNPPAYTTTAVEQVINQIITVADWLLDQRD